MKRPSNFRPGYPSTRVRQALSRKQLAEIGAVIIAWNGLEAIVDWILIWGLTLPELFGHDIVSRINGLDGKIAIIHKIMSDECLVMPPNLCKAINSTLSALGECKTIRDAVAHAQAPRSKSEIAQSSGKRGKVFDVFLSASALRQVADRIESVAVEAGDIGMMFNYKAAIFLMHDANVPNNARGDQAIRSLEQDFKRHANNYLRHQRKRASLPPLPQFPSGPILSATPKPKSRVR